VVGQPLLETRGVTKRFGAVQALTKVDFDVCAGEVVALVGDNGAGKSTLIVTTQGSFFPSFWQIETPNLSAMRIGSPSKD